MRHGLPLSPPPTPIHYHTFLQLLASFRDIYFAQDLLEGRDWHDDCTTAIPEHYWDGLRFRNRRGDTGQMALKGTMQEAVWKLRQGHEVDLSQGSDLREIALKYPLEGDLSNEEEHERSLSHTTRLDPFRPGARSTPVSLRPAYGTNF